MLAHGAGAAIRVVGRIPFSRRMDLTLGRGGLLMWRYVERLLDTRMLSPHGICLLWRPELLWTHVVSDVLIFSAYMTIPVALAVILRKRTDVPFGWVIWCFALFIMACGFTHLMGVWTLWHPDYGV